VGVSVYFVLIVMAIVFGGWIMPGTAVASIPSDFNVSTSRSAAADLSDGRTTGFDISTAYDTMIPVRSNMVAVAVPGKISIFQPAATSGAVNTLANISLSGVEGEAITVPRSFLNSESLAVSSFC
jgi:hypothetical protein